MKKIAFLAAFAYGIYYVTAKGKDTFTALRNLKTQVVGARNLKLGLSQSTLDMDVELSNNGPTAIALNSFGLAAVKRINLYSIKGTLIGSSTLGTTSLHIPAQGKTIIKNIPTVINNSYVLEALGDIANITSVTTTMDVEVGGKTITI